MKRKIPFSTIILIASACAMVALLLFLLVPKKADKQKQPPLSALESTLWKLDTAGGKRTLQEIGYEVDGLSFAPSNGLLFLTSPTHKDKLLRAVPDDMEGCILYSHTSDAMLRLSYEEYPVETLVITGKRSHCKLYFIRN